MKKLNLVFAILIAFVTLSSCNRKDKVILTPEELLVQNSPWVIDHATLSDVVNNGNPDFDEQQFLNDESEIFIDKTLTLTFNQDGTGSTKIVIKSTGEVDTEIFFTWEILADNKLALQNEDSTNAPELYDFEVLESQLDIAVINGELDSNVTGVLKYICYPKK